MGDGHLAVRADVSREDEVGRMVDEAMAAFGKIDILINNAGVGDGAVPTLAQTLAVFEKSMAIHVNGTFLVSKAVAARMAERKGGAIVNLGAIAGQVGVPVRTACSVAKAGIGMIPRARLRMGQLWNPGQCGRARLRPHAAG